MTDAPQQQPPAEIFEDGEDSQALFEPVFHLMTDFSVGALNAATGGRFRRFAEDRARRSRTDQRPTYTEAEGNKSQEKRRLERLPASLVVEGDQYFLLVRDPENQRPGRDFELRGTNEVDAIGRLDLHNGDGACVASVVQSGDSTSMKFVVDSSSLQGQDRNQKVSEIKMLAAAMTGGRAQIYTTDPMLGRALQNAGATVEQSATEGRYYSFGGADVSDAKETETKGDGANYGDPAEPGSPQVSPAELNEVDKAYRQALVNIDAQQNLINRS